MMLTIDEYMALRQLLDSGSGTFPTSVPAEVAPKKKKRKVGKYQREFGRQLKRLKVMHPRTPVTRLMKRAHTATRKAMK